MTIKENLITLARAAAFHHKLDPALVCAVVHRESSWNPLANRYEPAFYAHYIEKMNPVKRFGKTISKETEMKDRATSFGLMQVMGQVAREMGFAGEFLTELTLPEVGLEYGCRKLEDCFKRAGGDREKALLRYNGGGEPLYPSLVMENYHLYK